MKTLNEKEIIRLIQKKEIIYILSFNKYYNLSTELRFYEPDINEKFNKLFNEKENIVRQNGAKKYIIANLTRRKKIFMYIKNLVFESL